MKVKLERWAPVGANAGRTARWIGLGLGLSAGYSLLFYLFRYFDCRSHLYTWERGRLVLTEGAVMVEFGYLLDKTFLGFALMALCMAGLAVWHYAGHYQGGRSIYIMRRLPDRWELHRRCLTLPMLGVLGCLVCAIALLLIYYAIYQNATPEQCLPGDQWARLWQIWMRGY